MNKEENDDAFIGLDISIKDDNLVSASPTRSRKRDRPPSSPAVALFKDGRLVHMIERHHIEGNPANVIAENLKAAFDEYC